MKISSTIHLPIHDLTPFTMQDYPDKTSCVVWVSGCNMRCPYCHNPDLIHAKGAKKLDEVFEFLQKRKNMLDGVVLSGGEITVYKDIIPFIRQIKSMGFLVKIDTNGTRPEIIEELLKDNLIDFIAMDYKAPESKFPLVTKLETREYVLFKKSLAMMIADERIEKEIRTTVHTDLLDENDINTIIDDLEKSGYKGNYYIQNFNNNNGDPILGNLENQKHILNRKLLNNSDNIKIGFRNFPERGE